MVLTVIVDCMLLGMTGIYWHTMMLQYCFIAIPGDALKFNDIDDRYSPHVMISTWKM